MACVKVHIDQDLCTACSLCYERLPEVFQDSGDGIATVGENNEGCFCDNVDEIKEVADECPASCIIVEDVDGC